MKKNIIYLGVILLPLVSFTQQNNGNNANENALNAQRWRVNGNEASENHFIGTKNDAPLNFRTNNENRLHITPDGKIGFGTSLPEKLIDINGSAIIRGELTVADIKIETPIEDFDILYVDKDGLIKRTTIRGGGFSDFEPAPEPRLCANEGEGVQNPRWRSGLNKIYSSCPEVNVGVGLASPQYRLHISGTTRTSRMIVGQISSTSALLNVFTNNTTNSLMQLGNQSGGQKRVVHEVLSNGSLRINSFGGSPITVRNYVTGKKLLELKSTGLLRAREINVDTETWPDYVFQPDYKLMSLSEVKTFIDQNGHLPNVPSAEEVEADGVNLGETAKITMEKVEELTLYLIQQQELLEKQQKEIELLKEELLKQN